MSPSASYRDKQIESLGGDQLARGLAASTRSVNGGCSKVLPSPVTRGSPEVVELAGGKLMMIARTQMGDIATSRSDDGGDHWSEPSRLSVNAPESPATIRRVPATGDLLLVWNNNYQPGAGHGGARTPLTTAISTDEGQTWRAVRNLETAADQSFAYTSVLFVRDRLLLSYYVGDAKTGHISSRFRSLPVRWLYSSP